jgi:hypothetical protein
MLCIAQPVSDLRATCPTIRAGFTVAADLSNRRTAIINGIVNHAVAHTVAKAHNHQGHTSLTGMITIITTHIKAIRLKCFG